MREVGTPKNQGCKLSPAASGALEEKYKKKTEGVPRYSDAHNYGRNISDYFCCGQHIIFKYVILVPRSV